MLGTWRSHDEYLRFVRSRFLHYQYDPSALLEYRHIISKLTILNLDPLHDAIAPLYSPIGRTAIHQPEIFRVFIAMQELNVPPNEWTNKLRNNFILRSICGLRKSELPGIASFYDFIRRITGPDKSPSIKRPTSKPKKKLGKGEKLPPKHPNITAKLKKQIMSGRRFTDPLAKTMNRILAPIVEQSLALGLLDRNVDVSGDGTCVPTGGSSYGKRICGCKDNGIYRCDCPRFFSDPGATWGWDSHNERYFYGYTGYFISTYNKTHKIDLPLYLRIVDAKRHDSVSALVALSEFRDLYPVFNIRSFISDSASDNYATYELLEHWNINAVIALGKSNNGNNKYPLPLKTDSNGSPICPAGNKMVYSGFCGKDRCRVKWRCPRVLRKAEACPACDSCSPSAYGRVVYTKPDWDLRLFGRIPRGSNQWKQLMKQRTAAERVNNRILNDYRVEKTNHRGKKRISFFVLIAAINIHLDAQLKVLQANGDFDPLCHLA